MRFLNYIIFPFLIIVFYSCDEKDDNPTIQLTGSWLLYERGYSPGGGYITEAVSSEPAQVLIFETERMSSTVNGFESFKFYEILTDTATQTEFVALYKNRPSIQNDESSPTYSFDITGDTLKLYFRYCIEGCHLAFRRID
ncbi:MAG TPA: hypothetical protein VJ184_08325 [Chryseolinea sp.]|nr:hypothetical protein [Chryseolinea sp.]